MHVHFLRCSSNFLGSVSSIHALQHSTLKLCNHTLISHQPRSEAVSSKNIGLAAKELAENYNAAAIIKNEEIWEHNGKIKQELDEGNITTTHALKAFKMPVKMAELNLTARNLLRCAEDNIKQPICSIIYQSFHQPLSFKLYSALLMPYWCLDMSKWCFRLSVG